MTRALNISAGSRFGGLVCIEELPRHANKRFWRMRCDCGVVINLLQKTFVSATHPRISCGCDGRAGKQHGLSNTPEYRVWINMKTRCYDDTTPFFENWGGRGIKVCDRWLRDFEAFLEDLGERPSPKHTLDRIDNDGHYEPGNCRWAVRKTQSRNIRSNKIVTFGGVIMTLAEAAESATVPYNTILFRLKRGWCIEDAIARPAKKGFRPHG